MALYFKATIDEIRDAKNTAIMLSKNMYGTFRDSVTEEIESEQESEDPDDETILEYMMFRQSLWINSSETMDIENFYSRKGFEGARVFVNTFLEVAQDLVPVDTGTLLNSIDAKIVMKKEVPTIICVADTDYAEYVEYGTSKQVAQPYFMPALMAAFEAAIPIWESEEITEILEGMFMSVINEAPGLLYFLLLMLIMLIIGVLFSILIGAIKDLFGIYLEESYVSSFISIQ